MLKGLRWPLLALVFAGGLLLLAVSDAGPTTRNRRYRAAANAVTARSPQPRPHPNRHPCPPSNHHRSSDACRTNLQPLPPDEPPLPPENILVEALIGEIHKLNPLLATNNPVDRDITSLIFEGLTTTNDYGEIIPDLAKSWTVSTGRAGISLRAAR